MNQFSEIGRRFKNRRVVIVGDLVADQFLSGTITRVSREAPVFIMRHDETETRPGGAANAALNVAAMGGNAVLIAAAGNDTAGNLVIEELRKAGVDTRQTIIDPSGRTTAKVRVLTGQRYAPRHQVIRIDYENTGKLSAEIRSQLTESLFSAADSADAIVISDYNYGVADHEIAAACREIARARSIPLLVDSRFRLAEFADASSATPNQEEVEFLLGGEMTDNACEKLRTELGYESLLVTCGNRGMKLYEQGAAPLVLDAVGSENAVDVTGAGDTVIAAYALALAGGFGFADAARIANHAGGLVVMKKGTASVSQEELIRSLAASETTASHPA